tara:strand:- start:300 stop:506 length:207 start_codon:yes stop_codon:yes gene_type:complete
MNTIITYLFIGVIVAFLIDVSQQSFRNKGLIDPNLEWTWVERVVAILLWPYGVWVFIRSFFGNNNNNY